MDYANDNNPPEIAHIRGNYPLLALAVLVSFGVWFVLGLTIWRAFKGWR